jgi:Spy/CpxP family protein refolding chaperone
VLAPVLLSAQAVLPSQTGTVSGIVRDVAGQPVSGIRVTAMPEGSNDNGVQAMSSLAVTDQTGRYTLENVPAGRYFISAGRVDLPTFYPATLDMAKATTVSVSTSTSKVDINISLQPASSETPNPQNRGRGVQRGNNANVQRGPAQRGNVQRGNNGNVNVNPFPDNAFPFTPQQLEQFTQQLQQQLQQQQQQLSQLQNRMVSVRDRLNPQAGAAWWTNTALVRRLGLTEDQKKKIETIFDQHRSALIQKKTDLEKEESSLARMLESEPLEHTKFISAQIDRVIQARGEMEKTNSTMTLEMRQVLTRSQWLQLQNSAPQLVLPTGAVVIPQPAPAPPPPPLRFQPTTPDVPRFAPLPAPTPQTK